MEQEVEEVQQSDLYYRTKYSYELVQQILTNEHRKEDKKIASSGRLTSYQIGDIVFVAQNFVGDKAYKLKAKYVGPYRVVDVISSSVKLLNLSNGKIKHC